MFSIQAHDKGLFLKVVQQIPESHLLLGDKHRVQQILINLISNAIKFTEQGGVTLSIWHVDGQIHFKVKDSGIGIPSETVEQVFKRFEQADSSISRRFGGSGLGLYISINLAKLMGGDIRVESIEGEGSQFQLNLPYKVSTLPAEAHANQYDNEGRSPVESLHGNLLVAEDTLELQILERRMLESMGFTVAIAENGLKAVELASTQPFDAVLMDMQMPVMDGIEATQNIRQQHPELPIIAVTANVMQKHRDAFHAAGCSGFISKPIDRNVLRETLTEMLKL
jgi:CheY-like chemotaxis protein